MEVAVTRLDLAFDRGVAVAANHALQFLQHPVQFVADLNVMNRRIMVLVPYKYPGSEQCTH